MFADADRPLPKGFASDADLTHRWVAQYRIPVVKDWSPDWRYEVALVAPGPGYPFPWDYLEPTEDEARIIGSYIDFRRDWYSEGWRRKMLARPLDVDSGTNTVVLAKLSHSWVFRRASWTMGAPLFPLPLITPLTFDLVGLLDHVNDITDRWAKWKAAHPDVFGAAQGRVEEAS